MSNVIDQWVDQHQQRLLDELLDFLRIPSISTLPENKPDVQRAAQFVADKLKSAGLQNVEVIPTEGHPLVYGDWLEAGPNKPTVLCYGHYDVQPPDPLELWSTPPFEPTIRNGNIYARGSADDKGQMYMHIKAIEALMAKHAGKLPINVKFLIEGEEEIGGAGVAKYVHAHHEQLKADVALVSDTELFADGVPTLCIGLRGLVYTEIEMTGPAKDLHSGMYGGAAPNAVFALIELLARAKTPDGFINLPGFYNDVEEPDPAEMESWNSLPFSEETFLKEIGSTSLTGEPDRLTLERIWSRPTFEVHGIVGGFQGAGAKTVIPAKATAKVSMRLVPNMKADRALSALRRFVSENTPAGCHAEVKLLSGGPAILIKPDHPAIRHASAAMEETMENKTVFVRGGGSIPIVGDFQRELGIPTILMGFGLPDDGLHSPNEKYRISNYYLGIRTIARFFERYSTGDGHPSASDS
jgi:acetylornithine deacetylase/succinyl-diaminopimelate desuccinylase-like protein